MYASGGDRSWTPSAGLDAGEVRMALRMRHENGIAVGMRSRSEEYLRMRNVLCSVYAGGALGVLVMYVLLGSAALGIDEDGERTERQR